MGLKDMATSAPEAAVAFATAERKANGAYPLAEHKAKKEWDQEFPAGSYVDMRQPRMEELAWKLRELGCSWKQVMFALTQKPGDVHSGPQTPDATTFAYRRWAKAHPELADIRKVTGGLALANSKAAPAVEEPVKARKAG